MTYKTGIARAAVAACVLAVLGLPAFASPPPADLDRKVLEEANCVYDQMTDEAALKMVDTYLDNDVAKKPEVEKLLASAHKTCGDKYKWGQGKHDLAGEIALHAAVIDVLLADMLDAGLKSDKQVVDVWDKLPESDLNKLFADTWRSDAALVARLDKALVAGGVPDKPDMLENGVMVLVSASREAAAMDQWVHDGKPN